MIILAIKIAVTLVCAGLFWWGGFSFLVARRFIMPSILTLACLVLSHFDWYCVTMLSCMGIFCLGYGTKSPLRRCFGNGWGRGIWGLLGAITLSLAAFLTGHIALVFFLLYLGLNFTLENALKDIPQVIGDPIIGMGFASIVWIIHG